MTRASRLKRDLGYFFALSRTPHAVLDLAAPALTALLWLDRFPAFWVVAVGLVTSFAGYTAIYALNDLVDARGDRRRLAIGCSDYGDYLDAATIRHPVAQGCLSLRAGASWAAGWGAVSMFGAWLLNPVCMLVFLAAGVLETLYCLLVMVTPLRALVSGLVKTAGPVAAILVVDRAPDPGQLAIMFVWLYLWEIGGQNIPADWADIEEDRSLGVRTLPVRLSTTCASRIAGVCLIGTVAIGVVLGRFRSLAGVLMYGAGALAAGVVLLLVPAIRLMRRHDRSGALALFNRASYYPLGVLGAATLKVLLRV